MPIIDVPGYGETEFPDDMTDDQIVAAIQRNMIQPQAQAKQAIQPLPKNGSTFAGEGFLRGIYDPITGLAQGAYNLLPKSVRRGGDKLNNYLAEKTGMFPVIPDGGFNEAIKQDEESYQQRRGGGTDVQRIAGNVVSPVNALIAMKAPQAASMAGRIVSGSGVGATQAMTMPVTTGEFADEKIKQGTLGAALGGVLPILAGGVARVVSPNASRNPDLALLKSLGITPTIGQTLGGAANVAEQKATSLFGVGDSIAAARNTTRDQFNKAVINDVVEPIGRKVDEIGREGVKKAGDLVSGAYDDVWKTFSGVNFDRQFAQDYAQLKQLATGLTPDMQRKFHTTVNNYLASRISPNGGMTAETMKKAYSDIGEVARQYAKSSGSEGELGNSLKTLQSIMMDQVSRTSPAARQSIKAADTAWARLVRLEDAAKRSAVSDGAFTPGQYLSSVRGNSAKVRGRDFSRGTALGQKLGEAGQRVLGNTYPDSGTAGRLLNIATGAGAITNPLAVGTGLAVGMGAYTPTMQKALASMVTNRPASAAFTAEEIRKLAPLLNPAAYGLLNGGN